MRRITLILVTALAFALPVSGIAFADSTSDYNVKVAAAQAKVNDAQTKLQVAEVALESLKTSSNGEAELLAAAQTAMFDAKTAVDSANAVYSSKRSLYEAALTAVNDAVDVLNGAVYAVSVAADASDSAYNDYVTAQSTTEAALTAMNTAQAAYDGSSVTSGGPASSGLTMRVYNNIQNRGNPPTRSDSLYTLCKSITVSNIDVNWGGGGVTGCNSDYFMIHYTGYITYPTNKSVYFYANADDGFYMNVNGQNLINDWSLKGCSGNSAGLFTFKAGQSYAIDAWMYEWNGGACNTLFYQPQGSSQWTVAPASFFTTSPVAVTTKDPALKTVLDGKTALYVAAVASEESFQDAYVAAVNVYDLRLSEYDNALALLDNKNGLLVTADSVMGQAESDWQFKSDNYSDSESAYLSRKQQFQVLFDQLKAKSLEVDNAQSVLDAARAALAAIPKPTAPIKVVKKPVSKPAVTVKPTPKAVFVPNPKR